MIMGSASAARIKSSYLNVKNPGSLSGLGGFIKSGKRKESRREIENVLKTIPAYTLHRSRRKIFPRRVVYVKHINDQWGMDLMDVSKYSKTNYNTHFLLTAIDIFSKRGYIEPLKNKSGLVVMKGIEKIFKRSKGLPLRIQVDLGREFYNVHCKEFLEDLGIKLFSLQSELKSCVVERFNRTILEKIHRFMTNYETTKFVDRLSDLENNYNSSYHRSIKCAPKEVNKKNEQIVFARLYNKLIGATDTRQEKFKVNDVVLISKVKKIFEKGASANFNKEKFIVNEIKTTFPRTYILRDLKGDILEGGFYREEMQKI